MQRLHGRRDAQKKKKGTYIHRGPREPPRGHGSLKNRNTLPPSVVPALAYSGDSRKPWYQELRAVPGLLPGAVHVPGKETAAQVVLWSYSRICPDDRIRPGQPRNSVRDDRRTRNLHVQSEGTVAGPWLQRRQEHGQGRTSPWRWSSLQGCTTWEKRNPEKA